jgi:protein arginine kinase activator
MTASDVISPFGFNDLLNGLFGSSIKQEPAVSLKCSKCGMDYNDFLKASRVGCAQCYQAFKPKLDPIIKRLHGNAEHHGKVPVRVSSNLDVSKEIEKLKNMLNEAVANEEYEDAAKLRDKIRNLEGADL